VDQKEYAVIVAGGKGTRLKHSTPKQFIELNGKPVLFHTLDAFVRYSPALQIILVLPEEDIKTWETLVAQHHASYNILVQSGGETRFQSVQRGLEKITGDGLVAIHDGVRPLVSTEMIAASFQLAAKRKAAVAAVRLKDSIRMTDTVPVAGSLPETTRSADRALYWLIQTPQTFDVKLIQGAYQVTEDAVMTDDATVAERDGHPIFLFEGSYDNIKITTPEDLTIAEALLKRKS